MLQAAIVLSGGHGEARPGEAALPQPVPINQIAERWIGKFEGGRLSVLSELKKKLLLPGFRFVRVTGLRQSSGTGPHQPGR
jgi:hypothetical protein